MRVGIISDTHNLLRQEILDAFRGCKLIFHAGDIGKEEILKTLETIAPVVVVRGNNDQDNWAQSLPQEVWTKVNHKMIYMIHNLKESKITFKNDEIDIIVSGHSHSYKEEVKDNILYLNPGGGGPRRFGKPTTAMIAEIGDDILRIDKVRIKI